jgi:dolichol-phosphate mannosyltransferase
MRPRVLVNIPVLNEIELIERLLDRVTGVLTDWDYVLLLVDDGSTDGTLEYIKKRTAQSSGRIALLQRTKLYKGCQRGGALLAGMKWGLRRGPFDVFIELDGDLSHVPEEMPCAIEMISSDRGDVAIVSKYLPESRISGRSAARTFVSLVCNLAVRTVLRWGIHDYSNGFRLYNRRAAETAAQYRFRYGSPIYLTEIMAMWLASGMRVVEVPGHYVGRFQGVSKVLLRDYVKACIGVLEVGLRYHFTGFEKLADAARQPAGEGALERADG